MSVADIYNFEAVFEPAIAQLFLVSGFTAYTSQGKLLEDGSIDPKPDFQKDRPRVEIVFTRGAGRKRWQPNTPYPEARESAWIGNLSIALLTDADPQQHYNFLPQVRSICAILPKSLNGISFQNHNIHFPVNDVGETHQYNTDKGYYVTTLNYNFDFSVQTNAWALLDQ